MIKCIECGFETMRLQWTHFKYNCTGRFNNGTEYKKVYPNASLVDESLKNKTRITLENLISKYGEIEGTKRWNIYRKKQAESNGFEYKSKKYGWTKEQFDEYNSNRAITLDKCVERYGESDGLEKWNVYCQKQSYTNTLAYFTEKYGEELGKSKYYKYNKEKGASSNPSTLAELRGISVEEAAEIIMSKNCYRNKLSSKIEEEFTVLLESKIGKLEHTSASNPFGKWSYLLDSYVLYDIKHKDCIIEFNGDYWHCNPRVYDSDKIIIGNRTAKDIWEKDKKKIQTAIDLGYRVMIVWECDFVKDKRGTIEKVAEWMQNGQK